MNDKARPGLGCTLIYSGIVILVLGLRAHTNSLIKLVCEGCNSGCMRSLISMRERLSEDTTNMPSGELEYSFAIAAIVSID